MAESLWATLTTEYYYRRTFTTRNQVYTGVATWIEDFYNPRRIHTSLGAKSPPSKTNDTKRPGQQPHKQTVNNLHTGPDPNYTPNYEEPQKMSRPWELPPVFALIWALELGYVNDHRRLSDNELHAARGADARPHTGAISAAP